MALSARSAGRARGSPGRLAGVVAGGDGLRGPGALVHLEVGSWAVLSSSLWERTRMPGSVQLAYLSYCLSKFRGA